VRIRATGLPDVVRRLFRLSETPPNELAEQIQATVEARAIRPWEDFDEGIVRWCITVSQPGVVAEFSLIGLTGFNSPGQWLVVVDRIKSWSGANASIRLSGVPVVFNGGVISRPRLLDARWGSALVDAPPIFTRGSNAAQPGTAIDATIVQQDGVQPIIIPVGLPYPGGSNILVVSSLALNTAIDVTMQGRAIPWRER
jgi:hypothetical protein